MSYVETLIQRNLKHVRDRDYSIEYLRKAYAQREGKYREKVAGGTYTGAIRDLYADKEAYRIALEEKTYAMERGDVY